MDSQQHIAIIGAGLSGLTLALALHQQEIACVLYESQAASLDIGGAIMLSPNALRILDRLDILKRLEPRSYKFEKLHFRSQDDQPVDEFEFGSVAKYGYSGFRVYRFELIKILLDLVQEAGIRIEYGKKFDRVSSETERGVTWSFTDGSHASASMLVGADGIHSRVRSYLHPDVQPKFTNMIGITAAVPTEQLQVDKDYPLPVTIMHPRHGAFVIAPQLQDGSEVLVGRQYRMTGPEPDRQGWKEMTENKTWCTEYLRQGNEDLPPLVARATSFVLPERVNLWPFYLLPKLDTWSSASRHNRVVILGDAAHAIPPTAGQGVNQAFEDVYTFAGVIKKLGKGQGSILPASGLERWQAGRQERVNKVLEVNERINMRRLPGEAEMDLEPFQLDWLYGADFEQMIEDWSSDGAC
ncbi:hypothetical protein ACJ41O_012493 [Fusarium nematophilum]